MRHYWPVPECTIDKNQQLLNRQNLVAVFNNTVGKPSSEGLAIQVAFIAGTCTYDDAVAYVRYAEYMIANSRTGMSASGR